MQLYFENFDLKKLCTSFNIDYNICILILTSDFPFKMQSSLSLSDGFQVILWKGKRKKAY